jgi:hypothetical protein
MQATKVITVRVSAEEARRAEIVARAEGLSVNEVFRLALSHYFQLKRDDAEFVTRARAMVARDAEIIGELA